MERTRDYSPGGRELSVQEKLDFAGMRMLTDDLLTTPIVDQDTRVVIVPAVYRQTWTDVPDVPKQPDDPLAKAKADYAAAATAADKLDVLARAIGLI